MEFWEIFLYSFIQGVTEFIPISSSAHLLLLENLFNWPISGRTMAIAAHLGTLVAVIIFLKKDLFQMLNSIFLIKNFNKDCNILFIRNLIIITLPIIIIGFIVFKNLDEQLLTLKIIAWSSIIGGFVLYLSDKFKNKERNIYSLTILESLFIGFLQVFALIPGASRSGTIITAARILKLNRIDATKIALFSGIPTIIGAVSLEILWLINHNINNKEYFFILIICILSFIFAYISIVLLFRWLKNFSFIPFVIYRILLGILILFFINI